MPRQYGHRAVARVFLYVIMSFTHISQQADLQLFYDPAMGCGLAVLGSCMLAAASAGSGKTRRLTDRLVRLMPPAAGTFLQIAAQGPIFAG